MKKNIVKKAARIIAMLMLLVCIAGCAETPKTELQAPATEPVIEATPVVDVKPDPASTEPATEPATVPTEPVTQPTEPATEPVTEPTTPATEPTEPKPTEPKPTEPKPTEPKPTESKPTEPKPTEPKPTEPKPTEPKPTEPKPTEPKPTEPKPTEPATEPTEAPKGVTEADLSELEAYARNYAKSVGFKVDKSLGYNNAGYPPALTVPTSSIDSAKKKIRGGVDALKSTLLALDDTTEDMFNGEGIRFNCDLFFNEYGTLMQTVFYG